MRRFSRTLAALTMAALLIFPVSTPALADAPYTVRTLHFDVAAGPGDVQRCNIIGDLYRPTGASPANRVPAILTTNGFGGSKDDQAGLAKFMAARGYAVLSYSGLGFGGSSCEITLDDPDWDGRAASQLVSFLGGANGIAYADAEHTEPVAGLNYVVHDKFDHNGVKRKIDPRVGMIGGSYGGQVQFATASVDPRVDAIIPIITWNDLTYSITPNNTALRKGVSSDVPGALNLTWSTLFFASGTVVESAKHPSAERVGVCPNFPDTICYSLAQTSVLGYPPTELRALFRHASVATYLDRIRIPVLLAQGQHDTLFNLNEAIATYRGLKAQGTPVKMIWHRFGHSGAAAPGELSLDNPNPATQYLTGRFVDWMDRYLKDRKVSTGPDFAYFRDWVPYQGNAAPAYASAAGYPVGAPKKFYLSAAGQLVTDPADLRVGAQSFGSSPLGLPSSIGRIDAISRQGVLPDANIPGTFASWSSRPLPRALTVAGAPKLDVRLVSPTGAPLDPAGTPGDVVLFAKVYDIAPDGTRTRVKDLVAPVRITDFSSPLEITLPAFVHRFQPGHRVGVVLASGDQNHRGSPLPAPITITAGDTGQALTLPVISNRAP